VLTAVECSRGSRLIGSTDAITVVIPVIDDAGPLAALLADLQAQRGVTLQMIVADGGSRDDSPVLAQAGGATVVSAAAGRGRQMNAGASAARGEWLCFLHADSRLTHPHQLKAAVDRLSSQGDDRIAGHFPLRFIRQSAGRRRFYRFMEAKTATGRRYTVNGDQGLLLRRDFFEALGGFDTRLPFLEDQRMAAAIERHGRWCLLEHRLATAARRFEREGERPRYLLMALIMAMYIVDVPAFFERASGLYARQRDTRRLALTPYFDLLRALWRECGTRAALRVCWRIAGVALGQSWQLFFAIDIAMAPLTGDRRHATRLHDRWLARVIHNRPVQALWMVVLLGVVFGPMQLWCRLLDR